MTMTYHTDLASAGTAMNAADVTTPDGELDAALVAVNTELDNIATANLLWDALNQFTTPGVDFYALARWENSSALAIVDPDAANPYAGRTLRFDNSQTKAGKRVWCKEAGLGAGETVYFQSVVLAASGSYRLNLVWLDSGGATLSTVNGAAVTPAGATATPIVTGTVPASTVSFYVEWERTAGAVSLDIYNGWVTKGARFAVVCEPSAVHPYHWPLYATATWDPANVADGAVTSTTVTVTGAGVGDACTVGFSRIVAAGWFLSASVTSTNTVTVNLMNKTGAPVDLASGTLEVIVWPR